MVSVLVVLYYFHRFELLESCLFSYFVFAVVSIMLEVTDIGDISYVSYFIAEVAQVSEQYVECNGRTSVTEVSVTIYGRTADVHAYVFRVYRFEKFFASGK